MKNRLDNCIFNIANRQHGQLANEVTNELQVQQKFCLDPAAG